jgi:hypothetical protein
MYRQTINHLKPKKGHGLLILFGPTRPATPFALAPGPVVKTGGGAPDHVHAEHLQWFPKIHPIFWV